MDKNRKKYKTGEVAKMAGISIRTLRYYDSIDLLKPGRVLDNGHRQYDEKDIEKLQLILGLKFLDFSLEDIKMYLLKPDVKIVDVLTYQQQLLESKIDSFKNICKRIDFVIEHYKDMSADRVNDIFSLYEMLQMVNHNETVKKYFPQEIQEKFLKGEIHDTHEELDKALEILTSGDSKNLTGKEKDLVKNAFNKFISDFFYEVTDETVGKTVKMLTEMSKSDMSNKMKINERDLYDWLIANLVNE